jgi:hypothetical protein
MGQSVKSKLDHGQKRSMKIGRGVRQGYSLSPTLFNLYSEYLTQETFQVFRDFKIGRQLNRNVKYADDLVLLKKDEVLLQGMPEIGAAISIKRSAVNRSECENVYKKKGQDPQPRNLSNSTISSLRHGQKDQCRGVKVRLTEYFVWALNLFK